MVRTLLRHQPEIAGTMVLEPTAGDGAIVRVLVDEGGCRVVTNDVDINHSTMTHEDARTDEYWRHAPRVSLVVANPPFASALDIVVHAVEHADVGVAMLLRKTWTEPVKARGPWLAEHPPTRIIGLPRHRFHGRGTDSTSCDWHIWEREPSRWRQPIVIDHMAQRRQAH